MTSVGTEVIDIVACPNPIPSYITSLMGSLQNSGRKSPHILIVFTSGESNFPHSYLLLLENFFTKSKKVFLLSVLI